MAGDSVANVRYALPEHFERLAGPPAIALVSITIGGLPSVRVSNCRRAQAANPIRGEAEQRRWCRSREMRTAR